jgi:hypothetical protein
LIREHAERLEQLAGPIDLTDVTSGPRHDTTTVALVDHEHTWTQPESRRRWPVIAFAAAAIVAVVVGGLVIATRTDDPTGEIPADQPTPVAPSTTLAPRRETGEFEGGGRAVTYTVPDGWESLVANWNIGDIDIGVIKRDPAIGVMFVNAEDHFYTQTSCPSALADGAVGPTFDDLVSAWATVPGVEASAAPDVTIDGFDAKHFEFSVPDYNATNSCVGMYFRCANQGDPARPVGWQCANLLQTVWLDGPPGRVPNQHREFWVLDVEGTRLMVVAWSPPNSSQQDRAALDEIVASIQID